MFFLLLFIFLFFFLSSLKSYKNFFLFWIMFFFLSGLPLFLCLFQNLSMNFLSSMFFFMTGIITLMVFFCFSPFKNNFKFLNLLLFFIASSCFFFFFFTNLVLFFIAFEASFCGIMMMVYGWGYNPERINSIKFFYFYIFLSIIPTFFCISLLFSLNLNNLLILENLNSLMHPFISIFFLLPFLVKLPVFFFHQWLIKAHVEAPTFASVFLAAILLKTGSFGLFKFLFFSSLSNFFIFFLFLSSMINSLVLMFQSDMKAWVAYSSVIHMTILAFCLFHLNDLSYSILCLTSISHAFSSSFMFFLCQEIQSTNFRLIYIIKNSISNKDQWFFFFLVFSLLLNLGIPISMVFLSELISFSIILKWNFFLNMILILLVILSMSGLTIYFFFTSFRSKSLNYLSFSSSMYFMSTLFSFLFFFLINISLCLILMI